MNLYLKQRVFTWGDKFKVYDINGNERYYVEGEVFSWGKKLHVYDMHGNELVFIQQQVFSFLPRYYINRNGSQVAQVVKEFTFFSKKYSVEGFGWNVSGNFWVHDYEITSGNRTIVSVSKEWFTLGDAYEIRIAPDVDEVNALAVVLIIDAVIDASDNN